MGKKEKRVIARWLSAIACVLTISAASSLAVCARARDIPRCFGGESICFFATDSEVSSALGAKEIRFRKDNSGYIMAYDFPFAGEKFDFAEFAFSKMYNLENKKDERRLSRVQFYTGYELSRKYYAKQMYDDLKKTLEKLYAGRLAYSTDNSVCFEAKSGLVSVWLDKGLSKKRDEVWYVHLIYLSMCHLDEAGNEM